jgi:hypothetical protein
MPFAFRILVQIDWDLRGFEFCSSFASSMLLEFYKLSMISTASTISTIYLSYLQVCYYITTK